MTVPLAWLIDTNVVSEMMRPRPEPRVAAAAATRGLAVVTRNTGEFRNTGVETVDPWTGGPLASSRRSRTAGEPS